MRKVLSSGVCAPRELDSSIAYGRARLKHMHTQPPPQAAEAPESHPVRACERPGCHAPAGLIQKALSVITEKAADMAVKLWLGENVRKGHWGHDSRT